MTIKLHLLAAIFALLVALYTVWYAHAHQAPSGWTYPPECCSGHNDCAPIDSGLVHERADGWHVVVPRGAHPTRPWFEGRKVFRRDDVVRLRRSGDLQYHLCIGTGGEWRCLYIPPGMM